MKTFSFSALALAACCAATASAQTTAIVRGHKVLLDRDGQVMAAPQTTPPPAPLVGGADSCVTPDLLTGVGQFAFDNSVATTGAQGQTEGLCLAFGSTTVDSDVWFRWTAPYTGTLKVDACTGTGVDTKIAAYAGNTCPTAGSALACNDDFCNFQSQITFSITSGNTYVIQVGTFPGAGGGIGTLTLTQPPPPPTNDSCATPTTIVGTGSFPYDTTSATTGAEGQNESLCNQFGSIVIHTDLWYTWVAPFTGTARVTNCGATNGDTKFAAYAGAGCPASGTAIACNDQACGSNASTIDFAVTQGSTYTLEIGDYEFAFPGPGTFTISQYVPVALDDCQLPAMLAGPGTYMFDSSVATDGSVQGGFCADVQKDLWYTYVAASNGSATITTCGLITSLDNDTVIAVFDGAGCPTAGSIACNDDSCGLQSTVTWPLVCGQPYTLQVGAYADFYNITGSFQITESGGTQCGPTGVPFCFGDGTGTACPCGNNGAAGNGCANSVNPNGANLTTTGNASLANDTLVLHGSGMPNAACLYFQGTTQVSAVFGDGLRCAGGTVVRLLTKTNVSGASQYPDVGNPSVHVKGAVSAPATRTYQTWYRNAAAFCTPSTFNLTNGVLITWQ
jgi:hypothetical protein